MLIGSFNADSENYNSDNEAYSDLVETGIVEKLLKGKIYKEEEDVDEDFED